MDSNDNDNMEIDNNDIDDDDEIIREIDIYVSNSDLNTYLLQFPTKPVYSDVPDIINAKFKPKHQKLNVEILSSSSKNKYTQPYISSKLSQRASLGVGIMNNGSMYVTPLSQILQMRPSFEHIPSKKDQEDNNNNDDKNDIDEDDDEYKKKDQEKVGLQKKESDRSQEARLKSYQYQQTQQDNEPYQKLKNFQIDSNESIICLETMIQTDIGDISVMESKTE